MSKELKKKIEDLREIEKRLGDEKRTTIRLFIELLLLLHQDLVEIKELLKK